ncbi:MAG: IPT/TIG domain-containing protein [bacterium]|nr:IPT/TIG domain-containing protein [bacterium]
MNVKSSAKLSSLLISIVIGASLLMPSLSSAQVGNATLIAQLQAQKSALMEQLKQLQTSQDNQGRWCYVFNRNLGIGSRGSDVSALQHALNLELGVQVEETGYFGMNTASRVTSFQEKHPDEILTSNRLSRGTGYVGQSTRSKLNQLYRCGVVPPINIQAPVISGVKGPTALKVGETGTWGVSAYDPENGSLSYSVIWGDETPLSGGGSGGGSPMPSNFDSTQTATFTHSYVNAGVYTPIFYVTDNQGLSAKTSLSVSVGPTTPQPAGYLYLSPASLNVGVGQQQKIQAFYQPPMPSCPPGAYCEMRVMPAPYAVEAQWISSNPDVASISHTASIPTGMPCAPYPNDGGCTRTITLITGISPGTTEIQASYVPYPNSYTTKATVEVKSISTQPSITVLSPNGGETWTLGQGASLVWTTTGVPSTNEITAGVRNVATGADYALGLLYNDGNEIAAVPLTFPVGSYLGFLKTSVNNQSIIDFTDGPIKIVAAPTTQQGTFYLEYENGGRVAQFTLEAGGKSVNLKAMYQPPMPNCPVGLACAQVMPAAYPVEVKWSSSNTQVATVTPVPCGTLGGSCTKYPVSVSGVAQGLATVKAIWQEYSASVNVTVTAPSTLPSITVLSPNGGETWIKGTTQTIQWKGITNSAGCSAEPGLYCMPPAPIYYDIKLIAFAPPCSETICPAYYPMPYTIVKNIEGSSYNWSVGKYLDILGTGDVALDGAYTIQICQTNSTTCDSSDSYFKIMASSILSITTVSLPKADVNTSYSYSLSATGGVGPNSYYWSVINGALPPGLGLNYAISSCPPIPVPVGTPPMVCDSITLWFITGTPTQAGTYAFELMVKDGISSASKKFEIIVGSTTQPSITVLSPISGPVGTAITITGTGFTSTGNTVNFGTGAIPDLTSSDGKTITFALPSYLNPACYYSTPRCLMPAFSVSAGTYQVSVQNANGQSNQMPFSIVSIASPATKFQIGDRVKTAAKVNVRRLPSLSNFISPILGTQAIGALGTVSVSSPNPLATSYPAYVNGYWWWYVDFDNGADGWVVEDYVEAIELGLVPNSSQMASVLMALQEALRKLSNLLQNP